MIITISGKARHGKDTCADILKVLLEKRGLRVAITRYSDHIKRMYSTYFGWDGEKTEEARTFLQWLGTEHIRATDPNFHVRRTFEDCEILKDSFDIFLIPDARFENELVGDFNIKVVQTDYKSELTEAQQLHESETALDNFKDFDFIVTAASGDFESIKNQLEFFITYGAQYE